VISPARIGGDGDLASVIEWLGRHGTRTAGRLLVVWIWATALALAWHYQLRPFPAALVLLINWEILKRNPNTGAFFECVNSALFHILLFLALRYFLQFDLRLRLFSSDVAYLVEAVVAILLNRRYGLVSLDALARFLLVASTVGFVFHIWQFAYVPKFGPIRGYSLALDIYYRWAIPVEMALVASPFLFIALKGDLRAITTGAPVSKSADAYYGYAIPIIAFGLFPGIGRSLEANCGAMGNYVAISGISILAVSGIILSLALNRRSILIASAASAVLILIPGRCIETPVALIIMLLAIAVFVTWRWLPKGRVWPAELVSA
jgi:hypothetical protein